MGILSIIRFLWWSTSSSFTTTTSHGGMATSHPPSYGKEQQQQDEILVLEERISKMESRLASVKQETSSNNVKNLEVLQIQEKENHLKKDDGDEIQLYGFVIRDSRRLVSTQIPLGIHAYDFIDITSPDQMHQQQEAKSAAEDENDDEDGEVNVEQINPAHNTTARAAKRRNRNRQLFLDGIYIGGEGEQTTRIRSGSNGPNTYYYHYRLLLQVLEHVLKETRTATDADSKLNTSKQQQYYFYMEANDELCVNYKQIQVLARRQKPYFLITGEDFSGSIFSLTFLKEFVSRLRQEISSISNSFSKQSHPTTSMNTTNYENKNLLNKDLPSIVGTRLVLEQNAWTSTRTHLVSHSVVSVMGGPSSSATNEELEGDEERMSGNDNKTLPSLSRSPPESFWSMIPSSRYHHWPRCLEPRRTPQKKSVTSVHTRHVDWGYFDHWNCQSNTDSSRDIYPCLESQRQDTRVDDVDSVSNPNLLLQLNPNSAQPRRESHILHNQNSPFNSHHRLHDPLIQKDENEDEEAMEEKEKLKDVFQKGSFHKWMERRQQNHGIGDGDSLGVDQKPKGLLRRREQDAEK